MSTHVLRLEDYAHEGLHAALAEQGSEQIRFARAQYGAIPHNLIACRDPLPAGNRGVPDWRWHLSIAGPDAVPSWDALVAIVHEARPGVPFAIGLPPRSWWINVHPHVLHVWEIKDDNLLDQWRSERGGHTPT